MLYGVDIPPERFKTELVVGAGILTKEQYRNLQQQIYGTREMGLKMQPVEGVLEYLPRLQQEGHDVLSITSRYNRDAEIAREWLSLQKLSLPLIAVGRDVSKAEACRGLDVYIDDDWDKLELLVGVVPRLFLFSWGYNQHLTVPPTSAQRVESWREFYQKISPEF